MTTAGSMHSFSYHDGCAAVTGRGLLRHRNIRCRALTRVIMNA